MIKPWLLLCITLPLTLAWLYSILDALTDQDKPNRIAEAIALFPFGYLFSGSSLILPGIFSTILSYLLNILFWYAIVLLFSPARFRQINYKSVFLKMILGLLVFCLGFILYGIISAEISDRRG
ncbi:hypothetical protein [Pollutibacter soli]|uniref:hypothetical protein n=1 Tax=Pollutibacter soli TaxID=3034157 RepID=UPI0030141B17